MEKFPASQPHDWYLKKIERFSGTPEWRARYYRALFRLGVFNPYDWYSRPTGFRLVDFGCGNAQGWVQYAGSGLYAGIERGQMFDVARNRFDDPQFEMHRSVGSIAAHHGWKKFDGAVFSYSLAHVSDPVNRLMLVGGLLKPGSKLAVLTNNVQFERWRRPLNFLTRYRGDPTVRYWFSPDSLRAVMLEANLENLEIEHLGEEAMWPISPRSHRYHMLAVGTVA